MNSKKWIKVWFLFIFIIVLVPFTFVDIYLKANYENNEFKVIVERQLNNNSIYGTALNQNSFLYKLELIKQVRPEIIALGSSRVMQFREDSFNTSFITAGGGMNYLNEGLLFLEEMYKFHKPKVLILGLDFWWFNDNFNNPKSFSYHSNTGDQIDLKKILKTIKFLGTGKVSKETLKNIFDNNKITNQYTNYDNLGFDAIATSDGFRSDGSRSYVKTIFGIKPSSDENFSNTFKRIEEGNARFQYGNHMSKERLMVFKDIINFIQSKGTDLVLFVPPVANAVYKKMNDYDYDFVDKMSQYIDSLNFETYNYHDLSILTNNDCECLDGFHGGDIVYKRILRDMYRKNSKISKYINIERINNDIDIFKGKTLTISPEEKYFTKEVDFLNINCSK